MQQMRTRIAEALGEVYDPCCEERGLSVVDMGLIEDIQVSGEQATVDLVLTSGWCPFMVPLVEAIRERIASLPAVADAEVRVVWDTAWSSDRLSDVARERLRFLPPPNQLTGQRPEPPGAQPTVDPRTAEVTS